MSDRLTRLRALTTPAEDRLARLRALVEPEKPKAMAADASRVARPEDTRTVAEHLGESRFPWQPTDPPPEPTLLTRKPDSADAARVRPPQVPALPQNTLTPVNPDLPRDRTTRDLERDSYRTPGPVAGATERALNVASGGLGRMVGGPLADLMVSARSGQPREAMGAARENRAENFAEAHPTAARVGDVVGLVGGMAGEMAVARGLPGKAVRRVGESFRNVVADESGRVGPLYHGTPHQFDKFSMEKIGTGEGARAFGSGLYFAEDVGVAKHYRDALSKSSARFDGVPINPPTSSPSDNYWAGFAARPLPERRALVALRDANGDVDKALAVLGQQRQNPATGQAATLLHEWREAGRIRPASEGHLLTTELPDVDPEDFLDWDKPLGQQSPKVRAILAQQGGGATTPEMMGREFYQAWSRQVGGDEAASRSLRDMGIPGNRYLDGMSRGKGTGNYNYVLFSDEGINITERGALGTPGEGGLPMMGGMAGGIGGAATGATQGDTPGERLRNAALGGLVGGVGGFALGRAAEKAGASRAVAGAVDNLPASAERGALGVSRAPVYDPTIGPRPDVSGRVNLGKFALDPTGEARLADQVARVVQERGIDNAPRTWDTTRELARELGLNAADLRFTGRPLAGHEALAIRNLVSTNIDQMTSLTRQLGDATVPMAQREALLAELHGLDAQNAGLLSTFTQARKESGRALNNLRMLANRVDDTFFWQTKALDLAGPERYTDEVRATVTRLVQAKEPEKLVQYLATLRQATRGEKLQTFWKANILTNPLTHVVNTTGNTTFAVMENLKDAPAALADHLMSLATQQRTVVGPSMGQARASVAGARKGIREAVQMMRGVPLDDALKRWDIPREINFDNAFLDTYTKTVFRSLGASDRVFRGAALRGSLSNQAAVLARTEGLTGKALAERIAQLASAPTDAMTLRAIADAEQATFTDRTAIGEVLGSIGKKLPYVVPFTRTPGAIATRTLEYSPLGLGKGLIGATKVVTQALRGSTVPAATQREVARLIGRGTVGTGAVAAGYLLAQHGAATGMTDKGDRTQRETNQLLGRPDAALKVGDTWYEFGRLAPLGNLLALGATLYEVTQRASTGEAAAAILGATARTVIDQPFLTGIRSALDAVEDPARTGRIATNIAGGFIPAASAVAAVARGTDPEFRQPTDAAEALMGRLPGLSKRTPPSVDQFGQTAKREGGLVDALFNPIRRTRDKTAGDPLMAEMARVGATIGRRGKSGTRTAADARALAVEEGPLLKQILQELTRDPEYQRADKATQADLWATMVARVRGRTGRLDRLRRLAEAQP